jgi:hypothetical protein
MKERRLTLSQLAQAAADDLPAELVEHRPDVVTVRRPGRHGGLGDRQQFRERGDVADWLVLSNALGQMYDRINIRAM